MLRISLSSGSVENYKFWLLSFYIFFINYLTFAVEIATAVTIVPVSGNDHNIFDSAGSGKRVFSLGTGSGGSITLKNGVFDARDQLDDNYSLIFIDQSPNTLIKDYTINIAGTVIASSSHPVINMGFNNITGKVTIVNGYINPKLEIFSKNSSIYRTLVTADQTAYPINHGVVINFKDSAAKLNLIQYNLPTNKISGDLYGSNNGDQINLQGGFLNGKIILGQGNNELEIANNACIDLANRSAVDPYPISGEGTNIIYIKDQAKIIANNNAAAIFLANANVTKIQILGEPTIIGGVIGSEQDNILNIGNSQFTGKYSTSGDLKNFKIIELTSPINPAINSGSLFEINNKVTNINKFTVKINTTAKLNGGAMLNENGTGQIVNYGRVILHNAAIISGLSLDNQGQINIEHNSNILFNDPFVNSGKLILNKGSDLSGIEHYKHNLTNNYNNSIEIDADSSIGKLGVIGKFTNLGTVVLNGNLYVDNLINNNNASIIMKSPAICHVKGTGIIDNNGIIEIPSGAIINATELQQKKNLKIYGEVNAPITLSGDNSMVEVFGGKIKAITGNGINNTLNITGPFESDGDFNKIANINFLKNHSSINHYISGISNKLLVYSGTNLSINENGDLSGTGTIDNFGVINIKKTVIGTANSNQAVMTKFNNHGIVYINSGNMTFENFTNNYNHAKLELHTGTVLVSNFDNLLGGINVLGGEISYYQNSVVTTNTQVGTATQSGIFHNANNQVITIKNRGKLGDLVPFNQINNQGILNITDASIVKAHNFTNSRIINAGVSDVELNIMGGQLLIGFTQSNSSGDPVATNTNGKLSNDFGVIKISNSDTGQGGDLSSVDANLLTELSNGKDQMILIDGKGTIGYQAALGKVTNLGKIIANGGNIFVGDLVNGELEQNNYAVIKLNRGVFQVGNIDNNYGTIEISQSIEQGVVYTADLSSASIEKPSTLNNGANQSILVNTGTIGMYHKLGEINNYGIFKVNNYLKAGNFNNKLGSKLYLTNGLIELGNIVNDGQIKLIAEGSKKVDLSSIDPDNPSTLLNNDNNVIEVTGNANIGGSIPLGSVKNLGIINFSGQEMIIGDLNQGSIGFELPLIEFNLHSGKVIVKNITNNQKNTITINGGDLLSYDPMNHSSMINQGGKILISGNGSIGNFAGSSLGKVSNYEQGIFEANGGDIVIDQFQNGYDASALGRDNTTGTFSIKKGNCRIDDVINIYGSIIIDGGDLSPGNLSVGSINNYQAQIIKVNETGTIGAGMPYKELINFGEVTLNGGSLYVDNFINQENNSKLQLLQGSIRVKHISNVAGEILIKNQNNSASIVLNDLSSQDNYNATLINHGKIVVAGKGTIGKHRSLGNIENHKTLELSTNICKVGDLKNYADFKLTNTAECEDVVLDPYNRSIPRINIVMGNVENYQHMELNSVNNLDLIRLNKLSNLTGAELDMNSNLWLNDSLINAEKAMLKLSGDLIFTNNPGNFALYNEGELKLLKSIKIQRGGYVLTNIGKHIVDLAEKMLIDPDTGLVQYVLETPSFSCDTATIKIMEDATFVINNPEDQFIPNGQVFNLINTINSTISLGDPENIKVIGGNSLLSYNIVSTATAINAVAERASLREIIASFSPNYDYMLNLGAGLDQLMYGNFNENLALKKILSHLEDLSTEIDIVMTLQQLYPELYLGEFTLASNTVVVDAAITERSLFLAKLTEDANEIGYAAGNNYVTDGFWVNGMISSLQQSDRDNYIGYKGKTKGATFGLDTKFLENFWIGLGFSNVNTEINSNIAGKRTELKNYQLIGYANITPGSYYVNFHSSIGFNFYKTRREISIATVKQIVTAKFKGVQPSLKLGLGSIYQFNTLKIIPNAILQYSVLFQDPYNEDPSSMVGLNRIAGNRFSSLEIGLGVKAKIVDYADISQTYNYDCHFMILRDLKASPRILTAEFIGGGNFFSVVGAKPDPKTYNFGLSFHYKYHNQLQLEINYDLRKKTKFIGHAGSVTVRYDL